MKRAPRPAGRIRPAALLLLAALAAGPGCRSLLPREDDSTLATIGKAILFIPVAAAALVADGEIEDRTSVSPLDLLTDDCGRYDDRDAADYQIRAQRQLANRELRGLGR